MLAFSEWINSLEHLNTYLDDIVKYGIISVITLIALLPASGVILVVGSAIQKPFLMLANSLSSFCNLLLQRNKEHIASIRSSIELFIEKNSIRYIFV